MSVWIGLEELEELDERQVENANKICQAVKRIERLLASQPLDGQKLSRELARLEKSLEYNHYPNEIYIDMLTSLLRRYTRTGQRLHLAKARKLLREIMETWTPCTTRELLHKAPVKLYAPAYS